MSGFGCEFTGILINMFRRLKDKVWFCSGDSDKLSDSDRLRALFQGLIFGGFGLSGFAIIISLIDILVWGFAVVGSYGILLAFFGISGVLGNGSKCDYLKAVEEFWLVMIIQIKA